MSAAEDVYQLLELIQEHEGDSVMPIVDGWDHARWRAALNYGGVRKWFTPTHLVDGRIIPNGYFLALTPDGQRALEDRLKRPENDQGATAGWTIGERKSHAEKLLTALYEAAGGSTSRPVDLQVVAGGCGLPGQQAMGLKNDLISHGNIKQINTSGAVLVTAAGAREADRLLNPPPPPAPTTQIQVGDNASRVSINNQQGSNITASAPTGQAPTPAGSWSRRVVSKLGGWTWALIIGVVASVIAIPVGIWIFGGEDDPVTLRIVNEVTNGATNIREDDEPLYISREPSVPCALDPRCSIPAEDRRGPPGPGSRPCARPSRTTR